MTVIVVIACHFKSENELCDTTIKRLGTTLSLSREIDPKFGPAFIITGNVPYQKDSATLAKLMQNWLYEHGIEQNNAIIGKGVGIFSEARNITASEVNTFGKSTHLIVVSSDWYLWPGKAIWKKFARDNGLEISFHPVYGTGGWRTRLTYAVYGTIVNISLLLGFSSLVEKRLSKMQEKRLEGFTWNGCA